MSSLGCKELLQALRLVSERYGITLPGMGQPRHS